MKKTILLPILICAFLCFNFNLANNSKKNISENEFNTFCPNPVITSFSPSEGPENTLITITGSNFTNAASVFFDGISSSFSIINDTEITAYVPSGVINSDVISIISTGGCIGNSTSNFTVILSECTTSDVYISEIYDSQTGSPGIIELYNPTNTTLVFGGIYELQRYGDVGDATPTATLILPNSIGPLQTYIVKIGGPTACGLTEDAELGAGINDNDEIKLLKNGTVIDVVYAPNERGYTVIRNADAVAPNTTFNNSEWTTDLNESCANLGSHTADPITTTPNITHPTSQNVCENNSTSFTVSISTGVYTYQWKVLDSSGNWVNVTNNATYSGATTSTLTINNIPISFDNNQYYCEITSTTCDLVSHVAQLHLSNPEVDTISNQTVCTSYTLPALTNGNYFTGTNGTGTPLNAGNVISTSQTIYIYNESGTAPNICSNESSFSVTITGIPPVDTLPNYTGCSNYTLPALTNGNYFTGTNGTGTPLNAGNVISTSQTIYIYNESGTAPNICSNESSFSVTITGIPPVDTLPNYTGCSSYTLPALTNGSYFTGTNGTGTPLNVGNVISTSQTIYIYNETGTAPNICSNEGSFSVTITGIPPVDTLPNYTGCSNYTLPALTNGNYFTGTNGTGTPLNAGNVISTSQTIYIYNETGTAPNICSNENSFIITINPATDFTLDTTNIIINDNSITVVMANTNISYEYAVDNSNFQTNPNFINLSNGIHTLYVQDINGCILKSLQFEIKNANNIHIPLFFTPNNDGYNDIWQVTDTQNTIDEIFIFNRYGKLLKQLSPQHKSWNGVYNGYPLETNDYWYLINLKSGETLKGHFTLKR
jgi:gliding motility-associated-like protein